MKTWFITGASRGFGALIAAEALAAGDNVVAAARRPETVTAALGDHPGLLAVALDVNDEAQAREAVRLAVERFGRIDVLVNNAGFGLLAAVEEASAAQVEAVFRTNVFGLLNVTRAVLPVMRRQRAGHVINMSSVGGLAGIQGWGVYGATKFAVEGLTEALVQELKPLGIHATAVQPGFFRTDFLDGQSLTSADGIADYADTVGQMRARAEQMNHEQPGDPAKLARGILTLAALSEPPTRMPFGTDTLARMAAKASQMATETDHWRAMSASTDF